MTEIVDRGVACRARTLMAIVLVLLSLVAPAYAQQPGEVTADEVNAIAKKLYCPVCENVPLDACGTAACEQWRGEIRAQLEQGRTEEEVIANFVERYGERVVGLPQDPTLNALSLVTPWVISVVVLAAGAYLLLRWRQSRRAGEMTPATASVGLNAPSTPDDAYRARLEQDLKARR